MSKKMIVTVVLADKTSYHYTVACSNDDQFAAALDRLHGAGCWTVEQGE